MGRAGSGGDSYTFPDDLVSRIVDWRLLAAYLSSSSSKDANLLPEPVLRCPLAKDSPLGRGGTKLGCDEPCGGSGGGDLEGGGGGGFVERLMELRLGTGATGGTAVVGELLSYTAGAKAYG
jgi:hypothetical protein